MTDLYDFNDFAKKLKNEIDKAESIVVSAHLNADGDAVGSTFAFASLVEKLGKKPIIFVYFKGNKFDHILDRSRVFAGDKGKLAPDLFVSLDCGDEDRLGEGKPVFERAKVTVNIDHHISNVGFADLNLIAPHSSSTCELVYELASRLVKVDKPMAECLYTGLITDTCAFKHSSAGKRTMEIAGELMALGIDFTDIQAKMLYRHDMTAAKAFAKAILNARLEDEIVYTALSLKEIRGAGAIFEELDGIAEYCLNTNGAKAAVFLYEKSERVIKCSFRSSGVDVNKVAAGFGGGGHVCAAGCTIEGLTLSEALEKCVVALKAQVKEEENG